MLQLELRADDAAMLREALVIYLAQLRAEIAHTDSREFRKSLLEREQVLRSLVARLEPVPA
jgi:hypothetical protein